MHQLANQPYITHSSAIEHKPVKLSVLRIRSAWFRECTRLRSEGQANGLGSRPRRVVCSCFNSTNFNIGIGAVPEPSTWAMMIVGFGMVGGAMGRRRVSTKDSFA